MSARIVGVVDMFDALTSKRPYKNPYPVEVAIEIIRSVRDKHFDPHIVDVFLSAMDEIQQIKADVSGGEKSVHNFNWSGRDIENGMPEILSRMGRTLEN